MRPYIRATESGYPIPQRAGVLRYFIRIAEKIVWADRAEELTEDLLQGQKLPPGIVVKCGRSGMTHGQTWLLTRAQKSYRDKAGVGDLEVLLE